MQMIVVDTNKHSLSALVSCLKRVYPADEITAFIDPMSAVKFGFNNKIDLLFTEIPMRGVDGFQLVRLIREHNAGMAVCFVTETLDYTKEASKLQADGYLEKPITVEKLETWTKTPLQLGPQSKKPGSSLPQ